MDLIILIVGFILMAVGVVGCFVYKFPGAILAYVGILIVQFGTDYAPFTTSALVICAIAVIVAKILEKVLPKFVSKIHAFGKKGKIGCVIGSFIGIALIISANGDNLSIIIRSIIGLVVLSYVLATIGEYMSSRDFKVALRSGVAAWINYFVNTLLELCICIYCIYVSFNSLNNGI